MVEAEEKDVKARIEFSITFSDTGVGISKENISKLFQTFGKLSETRKQNTQGIGLGLSICHRIVQ